MRLAFDVRGALRQVRTGKDQWSRAVLQELRTRGHELILLSEKESEDELLSGHRTEVFPAGMRWHLAAARFLKNETGIDAYISPSSYLVLAMIGREAPVVPIIHDLIAFHKEPHDKKAMLIERLTLGRAVRYAKKVAVISEATKTDLLARYPALLSQKIVTVYAGSSFKQGVEPMGPHIFCPATLCPRKNQARLIRAYASLPSALRTAHPLILAGGRGWDDDEIITLARRTPGVDWKGYVRDDEYQQLLQSALFLAFPSLYEGFGLPVLDAMQSGVPVLTSDRGSLNEVAGDAAVLVDPLNEKSIAAGLTDLLTNEQRRKECIEKGLRQSQTFSWKKTVDLLLSALG